MLTESPRIQIYSFAPDRVSWGMQNRTCAVRAKVGAADDGGKGTYTEVRLGSGAANPYIYMAGVVAAGLDGIRKKMKPPAPEKKNAYNNDRHAPLPKDLSAALHALETDEVLTAALGSEFIQNFLAVKREELRLSAAFVSASCLVGSEAEEELDAQDDQDARDKAALQWAQKEYFEFL